MARLPGCSRTSLPPPQVQPQARRQQALWYALYFPQLHPKPDGLSESQQQALLRELAAVVENVSSLISIHPQALVFEIRSSLKYFGGADLLHRHLKPLLEKKLTDLNLAPTFHYAACPTAVGSLLLAKAGRNLLVYRKDNLRAALGGLPLSLLSDVLITSRKQYRRLSNMGLRQLRDIWRLPTDGLKKRFGSEFVNRLNQSIGKTPEPMARYRPLPAFNACFDLSCAVETLDSLLPVAEELLTRLCDFLKKRDLCSSHLLLVLEHEQQNDTLVNLSLRQATRSRQHIMLLLETRFTRMEIPAPVSAVRLEVMRFDAFVPADDDLLRENHNRGTLSPSLTTFLEQLQARMGDRHIKSIHCIADHCPEYASDQPDCPDPGTLENASRHNIGSSAGKGVGKRAVTTDNKLTVNNPRPFWLLARPQQLAVKKGRLYYRRRITLLRGPERIEARWWSGCDVRRDYYIAVDDCGIRLWIYHEKTAQGAWFLHGLFA
ncbi:MAG: DNA polymerase Y family protein [Pseudohongiellaceae bacterium]